MKTTKLLILTCALSLNTVFAQENKVKDNTQNAYEMPRTQVIPINSSEAKAQDTLYIKLPEGYVENNDIEYPVIYFTHPVQHIEILSALTENLIEDVILVGIPWQKGRMKFKEDQNSYVNFIRNDVFKTIENNYRTDPDNRTYFGYSFGALVGAYILSKHPNTFKNFILGAPAFGYDPAVKQKIYEFGSNTTNKRKELNANVFVSYGTSEKEEAMHHFKEFITILENLNDESLTFEHIVVEGNHQTAFPPTALRSVTWLASLLKDGDFPVLEGPYFGQKPPGLIPEKFAPGIVSTEEYLETNVTFLPNMSELSFTRSGGKYKEPTLFVMQNKNNRWRRKSIPSTDVKKYKERFNPSVLEMKSLEPFKDIPIVGFSASSKGTYYFYVLDFADGGSGHMSYSRLIEGKYEAPRKMSEAINRGKYIAHPFIAPDESYLIWDAELDGEDTPDIFISFRQEDGSWGAAINMGDKINTPRFEQHARVTPDGKYLFYWKGDVLVREDGSTYVVGSPYWVDFIQLKKEILKNSN